jgi:hypothetical protein
MAWFNGDCCAIKQGRAQKATARKTVEPKAKLQKRIQSPVFWNPRAASTCASRVFIAGLRVVAQFFVPRSDLPRKANAWGRLVQKIVKFFLLDAIRRPADTEDYSPAGRRGTAGGF